MDSSDPSIFPIASRELTSLLSQPTIAGVPLLVLLNKNDLEKSIPPTQAVKEL